MIETMQITAPFVESQENMENLVNVGEQRVDEATDMEGVEMSDGEAAAKGQKVITQAANGNIHLPSKQGG